MTHTKETRKLVCGNCGKSDYVLKEWKKSLPPYETFAHSIACRCCSRKSMSSLGLAAAENLFEEQK